VEVLAQGEDDPLKRPVALPLLKTAMAGLIGRKLIGKVLPARSTPQDPKDAAEYSPRIMSRPTATIAPALRFPDQRSDPMPVSIAELQALHVPLPHGETGLMSPPCAIKPLTWEP